MKWSLFNWKKPVVSSGEPEDYQVVKNTVNQNTTNIRDLNNQVHTAQGTADRNEQSINNINTQLTNTVSTNTAQTITGAKTFNANVVISNNPTPLILKSTNNAKNYVVFRDSADNSNLSIGANVTNSAIEVNRGDLTIETQQTNKSISINTSRVKFNRSAIEFGTDINAGYGGGVVKFIPEDNSTKTLQFFNNQQSDTRRFNIKISEPTEQANPATKSYVDNRIANINSVSLTGNNMWTGANTFNGDLIANSQWGITTDNITTARSDRTITLKAGQQLGHLNVATPTSNNHSANKSYVDSQVSSLNSRIIQVQDDLDQNIGYNLRYQDLQLSNVQSMTWGNLNGFYFYITSLQETKFLSAVIHYKGQSNSEQLARGWDFNYATTWGPKICFTLKKATNYSLATPDWSNTFIRIFYINTLNTLETEPFSIVEEE